MSAAAPAPAPRPPPLIPPFPDRIPLPALHWPAPCTARTDLLLIEFMCNASRCCVFSSFNKLSEAAEACASIGSTLATAAQLDSAHALGAEWCFCAAVSSGQWSFPMHKISPGCGSTMSVFKGCTAGGATCYGRKPRKGSIKGLLPFNAASYHAPGVTPPGPPNYGDNEGRHTCAHARRSERLEETNATKTTKKSE